MSALKLDPPTELVFLRPLDKQQNTTHLKLTNLSADYIVFKVKTTAPQKYCVRPNTGLIGPQETLSVEVTLSRLDKEPPEDYNVKDKFLVQGIKTQKEVLDGVEDVKDYWGKVEGSVGSGGTILEQKLRVAFVKIESAATNTTSPSAVESPATSAAVTPLADKKEKGSVVETKAKEETPKATKQKASEVSTEKKTPVAEAKQREVVKEKRNDTAPAAAEEVRELKLLLNQTRLKANETQKQLLIVTILVAVLAFLLGKLL